jgi:hypothetical protein
MTEKDLKDLKLLQRKIGLAQGHAMKLVQQMNFIAGYVRMWMVDLKPDEEEED